MQNRGILDYPGIVFDEIYYWIKDWVPAWIIISVFALLAAYLSMWVYAKFSKQEILKKIKPLQQNAKKDLASYDGPFNGLIPLINNNLKLSVQHMWLTLFPALLASIPLLFILLWLSNTFTISEPQAGDQITVEVHSYTPYGLHWEPQDKVEKLTSNRWILSWPNEFKKLNLMDEYGEKIVYLPTQTASTVLHKKQWWNSLIGNPAKYLDDDSLVEQINIEFSEQQIIAFGPTWMRGWLAVFMFELLLFSLFFKWRWSLH